jgi:tetratricopeptide (TPR) repeat protein
MGRLPDFTHGKDGFDDNEVASFDITKQKPKASENRPPTLDSLVPNKISPQEAGTDPQNDIDVANQIIYQTSQGIVHNPLSPSSWEYVGRDLSKQGRYSEAIEALNKAIELDPEYYLAHQVWNEKGFALYKQGRYDEAITAFDEAIRLYPTFGEACTTKELLSKESVALMRAMQSSPKLRS